MKSIILVTIAAAALALCACEDRAEDLQSNVEKIGDQIKEDPDIKEAGDAIKNAAKDGGEGIKKVTNEVRDTREAHPENQNTDESQAKR